MKMETFPNLNNKSESVKDKGKNADECENMRCV